MLLRNGKLLAYLSHPDVGWIDLNTGQQGSWVLSALNGSGYAKLDETNIIFFQARHGNTPRLSLLDVEQLTVANVSDIPVSEGYPLVFAPRSGLARAVNSAVVIYTRAQTQDAQPLGALVAQAQLDHQLQKLQDAAQPRYAPSVRYSEAEMNDAAAAAAAAAATVASNAGRSSYVESLSRQVRTANVLAAMRDGLPRDVVESIRNGSNVSASARPQSAPTLLADVPANAEVAMIGVYQARREGRDSPAQRSPGDIRVAIASGAKPLVLVLSSYEPVRWQINNSTRRRISAILVSGYHESTVAGISGVNVLKIGSNYAYKLDSPEYELLRRQVARYVASPVRTFQGAYEASEFSVSGGS